MIKPERLKKGDTVGVIAPASPPNQGKLSRAISYLEDLGLHVKIGKNVHKEYGYLAGLDKDRLEDFHEMFLDEETKAIFCASGGYGTARIADDIDFTIIKNSPKIFWGYSDITFLHQAINKKTGLVTFHGPMLATDIGEEAALVETKQTIEQLFEPKTFIYQEDLSPLNVLKEGDVSGTLVGGNLSLLTNTLGTKFEIETKDKILFIEEVNEEPRSIDRMLNQLRMAGKLNHLKGILIGDFHNCLPNREKTLQLEEVLHEYIHIINKPAMSGFKIGHCSPNYAIPLGVEARLNTYKRELVIESGVQ